MSLDRLSRKKDDLKHEIEYFHNNKIRLKVLDIPTTLIEPPAGQERVFDMVQIEKPDNWDSVCGIWRAGEITAVEAMRRLGLKKTKFYKMIKENNIGK